MTHLLNRRAVLASVPAIIAGTLPSLAGAAIGAADLLPQWLAERDLINSRCSSWSNEELDVACGPLDDLERKIMAAPICAAQDFAAMILICTDFGTFECDEILRQAACLVGQSHRIPKSPY